MSKKTKIFFSIFLLLWIGITAFLFAQEEGNAVPPCQLSGKVNYKGETAFEGLEVEAIIGEKSVAKTITNKEGNYSLTILMDDPNTPQKEGCSSGEIIYFKINGFPASQTFTAKSGVYSLDLSVASSDVKLTTWGKIKALFK